MTVPAGDDDRDDVDARFADIVARWEDPPPEALPDSSGPHDPADPADSTDYVDSPDAGDPRDEPRTSQVPTDSDTGSIDGPPRPAAGAAPAPRGSQEPEEPQEYRAPQDDGWRSYSPPEDPDEDHFTPPPPRPLPSFWLDWPFYLALVGIVGGPLLLIYLSVFGPARADLMWMAGGLAVAGFVTLVLRTPRERDPYDGDDGARV